MDPGECSTKQQHCQQQLARKFVRKYDSNNSSVNGDNSKFIRVCTYYHNIIFVIGNDYTKHSLSPHRNVWNHGDCRLSHHPMQKQFLHSYNKAMRRGNTTAIEQVATDPPTMRAILRSFHCLSFFNVLDFFWKTLVADSKSWAICTILAACT